MAERKVARDVVFWRRSWRGSRVTVGGGEGVGIEGPGRGGRRRRRRRVGIFEGSGCSLSVVWGVGVLALLGGL